MPRPTLDELRRGWWMSDAPGLLGEALAETLEEPTAERVIQAGQRGDYETVGRLLWQSAELYLDGQCEDAVNPPDKGTMGS